MTRERLIEEDDTLDTLAGEKQMIDDVESWFEFHKARNMTSHIYKESVAEETYEIAIKFLHRDSHFLVS